MMGKTATISMLIFFVCTIISAAPVYDYLYVNAANPTPAPPYDTWEKAATDIQTAVNAASNYDHVIVTNGVYSIGERITPGHALSNRVVITKRITVRSVNGPENTIILGAEDPGGGKGNGAVRCVFMTAGKLYGFTISNGFTFGSSASFYDLAGGGIWLTNYCVVTNCIISGNSALFGGGVCFYNDGTVSGGTIIGNIGSSGGGAYCYNGGTVSKCIISENSASVFSGGGVYCKSGGSVSDCTISGNSAKSSGGGVYCEIGGSVSNSTISDNIAGGAGGGVCVYKDGTVSDCTISGNSADNDGGGVHCEKGGTVSDCTISGNSAGTGGGGVHVYSGGTVSGCTISGNYADLWGGGVDCNAGGSISDCTIIGNSAVCSGGGAHFILGGALTNCLIYNMNTATFGGGAFCRMGGALYNCTIAGNYASDSGGGIVCSNGGTIINTIIYDNQAVSGSHNWRNYASGAVFSFCCTTPTNGLPGGNDCIFADPEFVDTIPPELDYRLEEISPCIDAGLNMPWTMAPGATDLDGNPRIYVYTQYRVDMGCYEFIPEPGLGIWIFGILEFYLMKRKLISSRCTSLS